MTKSIPQGYKQTEIGVIPEDWDVKKLSQLGEFKGGSGFPLRFQGKREGKYPFFKVSDMNNKGNETYMVFSNNYLSEEIKNKINGKVFCEGTVVFAKIGAAIFLERKRILSQESLIDNNMMGFILNKKQNSTYLYYFLLTKKLGELICATALPSLSGKEVGEIFIPTPNDPKEQSAIATALSQTDELIQKFDKLITKKKDIKKGAMQELLTGKKRLEGFEEKWEEKELGKIVEIKKGELITENTHIEGQIPVIAGGQTPAYYHNKPNRMKKTITISASGAYAGFVSFHIPPLFASDCSTIEEDENNSIYFLFYQLQRLQSKIYYLQTGGAQPHVHPRDLRPLEMPIPPSKEEQTAIANVLSDMDAEIEELNQKKEKLKMIKEGMMQQLLTGRIRVKY